MDQQPTASFPAPEIPHSKAATLRTLPALPLLFWSLAALTIPILCFFQPPPPGWDLHVYANAMHSLLAGHDPYADGMAVQRALHPYALLHPNAMPPYTYVYSPLTLPLLGVIARIPLALTAVVYWIAYIAAQLAVVAVCIRFARAAEWRMIMLIAPAAVFFPGLLESNAMLSGNLAYILYALVFAAALLGWTRDRWTWFYLAVLAASCCKAPLLSLVTIPVLSARRQWLAASVTAAAGLALFAAQPLIWPAAFRNYLAAVELQFSYNHDFGVSPAGNLGALLYAKALPYSLPSTAFYLIYASVVLATLLYLSRRYLAGRISFESWTPVMLVGVILLNPRIKEYDVAPLTLPMALIAWRLFTRGNTILRSAITLTSLFVAANVCAVISYEIWKPLEGLLLVGLFFAGSWNLLQQERHLAGGSGRAVSLRHSPQSA